MPCHTEDLISSCDSRTLKEMHEVLCPHSLYMAARSLNRGEHRKGNRKKVDRKYTKFYLLLRWRILKITPISPVGSGGRAGNWDDSGLARKFHVCNTKLCQEHQIPVSITKTGLGQYFLNTDLLNQDLVA